jgi:hypothetical protein
MHIRGVAAMALTLLVSPLAATAHEADADAAARGYFVQACADKVERVAVYAPDSNSLTDITTGATSGTVSWDRFRFEQLCARPTLYVYHCHTTEDVLTRFPSGSTGGVAGDFGNAAEMEFSCAEAAGLNGHAVASLNHALVTPHGEVIRYGFTEPTLDKIHEQGREFGRMLREGLPRQALERAQSAAQQSFNAFNAEHFDSFIRFAVRTCPDGDIEHCDGLSVERFASSLPRDDWRFIRIGVDAVSATPADTRADGILDGFDQGTPAAPHSRAASRATLPSNLIRTAQAPGDVAELTPDTLGAFVADGRAMVSICAVNADGLLPCPAAKVRVSRLAAACDRVKTAILDQDKYPQARYIYPVAKDRSLLLFKANPQSGLNERFDLAIKSEPTPQMIGMTLCDRPPMMGIPSFAQ